jgi:hypothetical protein
MSSGGTVPPVRSNEWLARFILKRSHLRQDRTVKQDAFIPHPYPDLSVTRHLQLSETQLWEIGQNVAQQIGKILRGRADVQAFVFQRQELRVVAVPLPENPNHANVIGWPEEKATQKSIAQQIAAAAGKALEVPSSSG